MGAAARSAVAKARDGSLRIRRRAYLGPMSRHTVFEEELGGVNLDIIANHDGDGSY